jgi:CubicO group peptidase (beta-lactamase class C family)
MKRLILAAAAACLALSAPALAQDQAVSPPRTLTELTQALDEAVGANRIPGAQVAIIENGEVSLSYTYGVADRNLGTPVTEQTVFRAGSISKSFVGVALMMAVEDGLLSLDTPIAEAAPDVEFINPWEDTLPVTLAHVMEHTAGFYDISMREFLVNDPDMSIVEGLAINPGNRISRWRPGTYASYANSGPPIAAHAIERVRAADYDSILRDTVLRPLGMDVSDLQLTRAVERNLSRSYSASLDEPIPYFHILMRPSGALNTTALELAQFVRMLIGRGEVDGVRLLTPQSVDRLERSETLEAVEFYGLDQTYGLGNAPIYAETKVFRGHDGAIDGFTAQYGYAADLGNGYVIMLNAGGEEIEQTVAGLVQDYLLRDFTPALPAPYPTDEAELAAYAGYYISRTPRNRFQEALSAFAFPTIARYAPDTGLVVAGLPRVPNGEHTMRRVERAESSFARAVDRTYRRELRYSMSTMVQVPLWQITLRLALPAGLALGALLALGYEIFRLPLFAIRVMRRRPAPPKRRGPHGLRAFAFLSGAALLALVFLFHDVSQIHYTQLQPVAEVSPLTLMIFGLTIAVPVFAALSFVTAAASPGEAGWGKRAYFIFATGLILAGCLWLSQWGWIGLRVWTF